MTPEEMEAWIAAAPYEELLRRWRFAPAGDPMFQGEVGRYYNDMMRLRRDAPGGDVEIGFDPRYAVGELL